MSASETREDLVVAATGLRKTYGSGAQAVEVLRGVDLQLARGEILALLGPNGAGKTTTVRILATLLKPDSGQATVGGFDLGSQAAQVRRVISLTGQQAALDELLTGRENLELVARLAKVPRGEVANRADELLKMFDLVAAGDRRAGTYSGGMRRRLDLAAGLVRVPQVLFLDEPTTGLDPRSRRELWAVVRRIADAGTGVFLTTQYLEEADELADRIAVINDGRVAAEGTAAQLKAHIGESTVVLEIASSVHRQRVLETMTDRVIEVGPELHIRIDGTLPDLGRVLNQLGATGVEPDAWSMRSPTLDDVFLRLTENGEPNARSGAPSHKSLAEGATA